jgi:hypothetical protein
MDQMQGKKLQGDMALQGQKDEGAMDRELAKGRVGLKGKLIDAKFKAKENQQKAERTSKDRK